MTTLHIRLARETDRAAIRALRRPVLVSKAQDGGLYELLTWPVYHCHVATLPDGTVVGYGATVLLPESHAEGLQVVVHPSYRRKGIGRLLLASQARDLLAMGWPVSGWTVPTTDELRSGGSWLEICGATFAGPLLNHYYYLLDHANISGAGPLGKWERQRLDAKAAKAREWLTELVALRALEFEKTALRRQAGA